MDNQRQNDMESLAAKNKQALTRKTFEVHFDLEKTNYEAVENIGSGAYGVVCSAMNKATKEKVAIKKIPNIFEQEIIAKRTYREIKILKHFKHDNIIAIREILKPPSDTNFPKDVYIVLDLMESDLHRIIHSKQELSEDHCKYFVYQILCGLQYIHSSNVVHRDLKPSNLLVNANCDLKIGDFGMARGMGMVSSQDFKLTQYVATRWYRAPELMASNSAYTASVDMWSVGCIFAELLGRKILFPGKTPLEQLNVIMDTLGVPAKHLQRGYHEMHQRIIRAHGSRIKKSLKERLPKASGVAMDLLHKLLDYDPAQRLHVLASLQHAFLAKYHDPDSVYEKPCIPVFDFGFEQTHLSKDQLKDVILKEIMDYHKPKRKSKIPFNFKPVSKSELEKTQQQKAAALRARQETEIKPTGTASNSGFPATQSNQSATASFPHVTNSTGNGSKQTVVQQGTDMTWLKEKLFQKKFPQNMAAATLVPNQMTQNMATTKPTSDVFKVPQSIPTNKQSLQVSTHPSVQPDVEMVSAGRSGSQREVQGQGITQGRAKNDESEVEMLSAKAEVILDIGSDFKIDLTTDVKQEHVKKEECKGLKMLQDYMEGTDAKPNTKEILKAAILSAALKKERGEAPMKPKPVTAVQRQREKEEKRRKKLARAKQNKKKKMKEQSPLLTQEDRDLLQRWTTMQKPKSDAKSHPAATSSSSLNTYDTPSATQARPPLSPRNTNVINSQAPVLNQQPSVLTTQVSGLNPQGIVISTQTSAIHQQQFGVNAQGSVVTPQIKFVNTHPIVNPMMGVQARKIQNSSDPGQISVTVPRLANQRYVLSQGHANVQLNQNPLLAVRPLYQNTATGQAQIIGTQPQILGAKANTTSLGGTVLNLNTTTQGTTSQNALVNDTVPQTSSFPSVFTTNNASQPQQVVTVSQTVQSGESVLTSSQQAANNPQVISPSEFLPFQTYDPSSSDDISNQLPTPDFSVYDSPPSNQSVPEEESDPIKNQPSTSSGQSVSNQGNEAPPTQDNQGVLSIITQLKKSHVNDPLMLVVTPKTAGEPYGVGPDMLPADLFMTEERQSAQMSAVSNASATESMIGDWLDLIGMDGVTVSDYETLKNELKELPGESLAP